MNVLRRIIYSVVIAAVATAAAIQFFPDVMFSEHVVNVIGIGFVLSLVLTALSFYREDDLTMHDKDVMMNAFLVVILVPSFYAAGSFVHESETSWSGGEIHYHADYEVIIENNGGELEALNLIDPSNFCEDDYMCSINDRTGITKYHEHNDNRIHLEGVFRKREDATLAAYFEAFGGKLTNTELVYPTNDGVVTKTEGDGKTLKVLVEKGVGNGRRWCVIGSAEDRANICRDSYTNEMATSPDNYVVSPRKKNKASSVILDNIFVVYDSKTVEEALKDVRKDGKYRGMGLTKEGEGF